jgi:hypothetical protein
MESMRAFANLAYYLLSAAIAIYGVLLASGKTRYASALTLQVSTRRRSQITGVLLVIAQFVSVLLMASGYNPFSQGAIVLGSTAVAYVLAWAIEKAWPALLARSRTRAHCRSDGSPHIGVERLTGCGRPTP